MSKRCLNDFDKWACSRQKKTNTKQAIVYTETSQFLFFISATTMSTNRNPSLYLKRKFAKKKKMNFLRLSIGKCIVKWFNVYLYKQCFMLTHCVHTNETEFVHFFICVWLNDRLVVFVRTKATTHSYLVWLCWLFVELLWQLHIRYNFDSCFWRFWIAGYRDDYRSGFRIFIHWRITCQASRKHIKDAFNYSKIK